MLEEELAEAYGWDFHQQRRQPPWWLNRLYIIRRERAKIRQQMQKASEDGERVMSLDEAFGGD